MTNTFELGTEYCVVIERSTLRRLAKNHPDEVMFRGKNGPLKGQAAIDYIDSLPVERRYIGCRAPIDQTGMCHGHKCDSASVS